jgi:hypothetical protein
MPDMELLLNLNVWVAFYHNYFFFSKMFYCFITQSKALWTNYFVNYAKQLLQWADVAGIDWLDKQNLNNHNMCYKHETWHGCRK